MEFVAIFKFAASLLLRVVARNLTAKASVSICVSAAFYSKKIIIYILKTKEAG
ncbi:hypothetical protein NIASO_00095 [Niabella soli DSM 19437]|uniref:Uncharacterized protein n=1 Tax=Niabella soli DSM 19437 TaxID=929713 RepID=W0F5B0_9BACT|nr:hypothetical protein NIASO_00095 [Niabella soli DSM 19437]